MGDIFAFNTITARDCTHKVITMSFEFRVSPPGRAVRTGSFAPNGLGLHVTTDGSLAATGAVVACGSPVCMVFSQPS